MRRAAIVVFAALAAAVSFRQDVRAAAPHSAAAQTHVLFRWTIPPKGHVGVWRARSGVLTYNGRAVGTALAPYTLPSQGDFAVQAMLRTSGTAGQGLTLNGFGLVVRQKASDPHDAVAAGSFFNATFQVNEEDNMPELFWNNQTIGAAAFQPGHSWHLYRLAVQGDQYSLSIDGKLMIAYTIPDYPNPRSAGVFSRFYTLQVKQFEIDAIGPPADRVPADPVPHDANLTLQDLPDTGFYLADLNHWYTNEESARESAQTAKLDNLDPALFQAPGREISYAVDYFARSRAVDSVYSATTLFDTAADARTYLRQRLSLLRLQAGLLPNAANAHDLPDPGLGDASAGYQVDFAGQGIVGRLTFIMVVRGRYALLLRLDSVPTPDFAPDAGQTAALGLGLARIVTGRLPAG